jgi:hypothetical protein
MRKVWYKRIHLALFHLPKVAEEKKWTKAVRNKLSFPLEEVMLRKE